MFKLEVAPVREDGVAVGYRVAGYYRGPWEDMWEVIKHPAIFKEEARAEALLAKIKASSYKVDFKNWILPVANTSYIRNKENPAEFCVV